MPWQEIEASLTHNFARKVKAGKQVDDIGFLVLRFKWLVAVCQTQVDHGCRFV